MKPNDKARELLLMYYELIPMNTISFAKQCALIAIDELIKYTPSIDIYPPNYQKLNTGVREYWKEVKQEIENL